MPKPSIILIRPQMGENIGAVARAMSNFGLKELRIVAPRDGWPNPKAVEMAAGAESIIHAAAIYPDFKAAMHDIQLAYATTARPRDMEKRVVEPKAAMEEIRALLSPSPPVGEGGVGGILPQTQALNPLNDPPLPNPPPQGGRELKIAFVFGPERSGIANEEITLCDTIITIPTSEENRSLNIAQSVVIIGYEWFCAQNITHVQQQLPDIAPQEEWHGLFGQLENYLDASDYFRVPHKKPIMWQNLQNMLLRSRLSAQEVRTFRGMLRSLWERRIG